jgi:hypothetical protein
VKNRLASQVVVAIVVAVFAVGAWVSGDEISPVWFRLFGTAALAVTLAWTAWDHRLWRLSWVQRTQQAPRDLRGTWEGELVSQWEDPDTGRRLPPKTVYLVIRQTSSKVSATLLTDESASRSSLAMVSSIDGQAQLDYLYLNAPAVRFEHRSRMHHGSASLSVSGCPASRLVGRYWTDRETRGDLDFPARTKGFADDYEGAEALFKEG